MNLYTDPRLLDIHGALDVLPELPLNEKPQDDSTAAKATGTDCPTALEKFAPGFAPETVKHRTAMTRIDKKADCEGCGDVDEPAIVSPFTDNKKEPLTTDDNDLQESGRLSFV